MYQFSLGSFIALFNKALDAKDLGAESTELRIKLLKNKLLKLAYQFVCRALFKADRLMFAMHMAHGMFPEQFNDSEWELFLGILVQGGKGRQSITQIQTSVPSWVQPSRAVQHHELMTAFPGLAQQLQTRDGDTWGGWARDQACERNFPQTVERKITGFQKVLVVQALRPDRLESAMSAFASFTLGLTDLTARENTLRHLFEREMEPAEPLLIIVSEGVDPSRDLSELAASTIGASRFHEVAMGQGQAEIAMNKLKECAQTGDWLCLKNLHLMVKWLESLEKVLKEIKPHKDFRLWFTSESHNGFPKMLLENSLKITYESPPGIKQNMQRTYDSWTVDTLKAGGSAGAQALFALAFVHAVLQERRVYIPQGWTKFYEFSSADMRMATSIVTRVCAEASRRGGAINWQDVHGLLSFTIYGGRIDSVFDFRVLTSYLEQYFNSNIMGGKVRFGEGISLPTSVHIEDHMRIVSQLPDFDQPAAFGLPANIARSAERANSTGIIDQLKILRRSSQVGDRFNRQIWLRELTQGSSVLMIWMQLISGKDLIDVNVFLPSADANPIESFVLLERYNAHALVRQVHSSLSELNGVIKGTALLTPAVFALGQSLLRQDTPSAWSKKWSGPEDPIQWCRELIAKTLALANWDASIKSGDLLSNELDMCQLFNPSVFFSALRQQTARVTSTAMDSLKFYSSWQGPVVGGVVRCKIRNLRIQGCAFDGKRLRDSQRDSLEFLPISTCHVAWTKPQDDDGRSIEIPLFDTELREGVIATMNMPVAAGEKHKWLQAGVALFLKPAA
jgi:dynein heavy chain 2